MAGEVRTLLIPINEITVSPGRREAAPGDVKELADSILEVGLINPVMVDQIYTLIAGLHRLEAISVKIIVTTGEKYGILAAWKS